MLLGEIRSGQVEIVAVEFGGSGVPGAGRG
jgi:hypothetical protein